MVSKFLIADLHFGHENILKHCRPQFRTIYEMNETIVQNWNSVVKPKDIVYLLGDIVWTLEAFQYLRRLQGRIKIILGNHDLFQVDKYLDVAEIVCGADQIVVKDFGKIILTHIPVHPQQLSERFRMNIHGHLHEVQIKNDPRYVCVSCEQVNFTPINLEEILANYRK